ncbi:hypothetical protein FDI21_gp189 [Pseudomonas phage Noxifer]|uniref:Uncharacterized protein n=1 Tax=Pseudomonas phage Noxifer TaxID=2006684 RepID=A0A1Y0T1E5_9CAUD|nr:hypothetical protein FDI21_gp189 [Pseudomonas phage Noxifer]ARV77358.1 hypothetical protein NOXIFER_189 [Pseudomonas phage Noxifer]
MTGCLMKVRPHRRLLDEAMAEVKEIEPTMVALKKWADESFGGMQPPDLSELKCEPYGYDDRIKWNTYIVHLEGWGVLGFTDGPVQASP